MAKNKRGPYKSKAMEITVAIIEQLYKTKQMDLSEIESFLTNKGMKKPGKETLEKVIKELCGSSLGIKKVRNKLIWPGLFADKSVGSRLTTFSDSKERLANKAIDQLKKQNPRLILLGAGTTVYYLCKALISRMGDLDLQDIYTNNIYVLNELILHNIGNIRVPEGIIEHRDGSISCPDGFRCLKEKNLDAIVTSFFGLSFDQGFSSDHDNDKAEKLMNLRDNKASHIYVVISWEKFGANHVPVVKIGELDRNKKYYIITDPPKNWMETQPDKLEEYKKWQTLSNVKFVFEHRD
jgi:DeoR/GlpR family transcriptional regulator of sugar metabolism